MTGVLAMVIGELARHARAELEAQVPETRRWLATARGDGGGEIRDLQFQVPLMLPTQRPRGTTSDCRLPAGSSRCSSARYSRSCRCWSGSKIFRVALSSKVVPTVSPGGACGTRGESEHPDGVAAGKARAGVGRAGGVVLVADSVI